MGCKLYGSTMLQKLPVNGSKILLSLMKIS